MTMGYTHLSLYKAIDGNCLYDQLWYCRGMNNKDDDNDGDAIMIMMTMDYM